MSGVCAGIGEHGECIFYVGRLYIFVQPGALGHLEASLAEPVGSRLHVARC